MSLQSLIESIQTRHSPIIVGDRYELAEALGYTGDNDSGLLAKADYQIALLSMSGYGKHVTSDMNGMFRSRRRDQPPHSFTNFEDPNSTCADFP
jgi:hypothetical protein